VSSSIPFPLRLVKLVSSSFGLFPPAFAEVARHIFRRFHGPEVHFLFLLQRPKFPHLLFSFCFFSCHLDSEIVFFEGNRRLPLSPIVRFFGSPATISLLPAHTLPFRSSRQFERLSGSLLTASVSLGELEMPLLVFARFFYSS